MATVISSARGNITGYVLTSSMILLILFGKLTHGYIFGAVGLCTATAVPVADLADDSNPKGTTPYNANTMFYTDNANWYVDVTCNTSPLGTACKYCFSADFYRRTNGDNLPPTYALQDSSGTFQSAGLACGMVNRRYVQTSFNSGPITQYTEFKTVLSLQVVGIDGTCDPDTLSTSTYTFLTNN